MRIRHLGWDPAPRLRHTLVDVHKHVPSCELDIETPVSDGDLVSTASGVQGVLQLALQWTFRSGQLNRSLASTAYDWELN